MCVLHGMPSWESMYGIGIPRQNWPLSSLRFPKFCCHWVEEPCLTLSVILCGVLVFKGVKLSLQIVPKSRCRPRSREKGGQPFYMESWEYLGPESSAQASKTRPRDCRSTWSIRRLQMPASEMYCPALLFSLWSGECTDHCRPVCVPGSWTSSGTARDIPCMDHSSDDSQR